MKYLVGIDVGTTGVKCLLVDERGNTVASAAAGYPLETPQPGWAEQDPGLWWKAVRRAMRRLARSAGHRCGRIAGVGLTGQMHGAVLLDRAGDVLHPAILWCDQRTEEECAQISSAVGQKRILEITCNPVLTGFQAPKILWLRNNRPRLYARAEKILLPKDYLRFLLTGESATDVSDASGTSLFDVNRRRWSQEIFDRLDIPPGLLPLCLESVEISGRVGAGAAAATGLPEGTPVVAGAGDQAAGGVGNGIVEKGLVSVTIGTSGVVFAHADRAIRDPQGRLHTFCHAVPGAWHLMGVMLSAGGSLRWFRDTLGTEETRRAKRLKKDPYDVLTEEAEGVPAGSEGLVFLPYLSGERCPHPDPRARGVFCGLTLKHTRPHMVRAVMEGITFGLKDCVEILRSVGVPMGDSFRTSGGGARSDFWCHMQADIFDRKIARLESMEGPAYGSAILAGVGCGVLPDVGSVCRQFLRIRDTFVPDRPAVRKYGMLYREYRLLYPRLRESFDALSCT